MNLPWIGIKDAPSVFHVYHLRRSGGHGVIAWLFGHRPEQKVHYNQCIPGDEGASLSFLESQVARYPGTAQSSYFELASFEDVPMAWLFQFSRPPASAVLVLRDPFNLFASRLQVIRKHAANDVGGHAAASRIDRNLWKQYAAAFADPAVLPHAIRVNFNRWYTEQEYRRGISEALGWSFTDAGFGSKLGWQFSKGSSFGEEDPCHLNLHLRWHAFREDQEFLSLFDDEILELAKSIFDISPDLPWTHRRAPLDPT